MNRNCFLILLRFSFVFCFLNQSSREQTFEKQGMPVLCNSFIVFKLFYLAYFYFIFTYFLHKKVCEAYVHHKASKRLNLYLLFVFNFIE